jgi:putative ABC transport system permease protein
MMRDLYYAWRHLRRSPAATIVAILALALGIGANASSFVGVNAILLKPFPYPDLDRIMTLWESVPKLQSYRQGVTPANFFDWQKQNRSFEQLSAYRPWSVSRSGADRPRGVAAAQVTSNFFSVMGMTPRIGRTFTDSEAVPGDHRVVILSDYFWQTEFAATPDILGRTISLGGETYSIVGVMPDDFDYPLATDLWVPLSLTEQAKTNRALNSLLVMGRLKPGVSFTQASAETSTIAERLEQDYPQTNAGRSVTMTPLAQMKEQVTDRFVSVLSAAALFLLLLAAANVANIQLARATGQQKAIAIESALGASRFQVARRLAAESILLALAGGGVGLMAAAWMTDFQRATIPVQVYQFVPGIRNLRVDSTVIAFTLALSLATGLLCSLPSIWQLLRKHSSPFLIEALNQGSRSLAGDTRNRVRNVLVVCEVAMALLLLVGAGVMVNTFQRMLALDLGYNQKNLLTVRVSLQPADYPENAQIAGFFDRVLPELSGIAGIKSVSVLGSMGQASQFLIENQPEPEPGEPRPNVRLVDDAYFRTMEIPILQGRAISDQDRAESTPTAVVNKAFAEHYWPGSDPIGRRIRVGQSQWLTIIGVAGDTKEWFTSTALPMVYAPYRQTPVRSMRLYLRTEGDPLTATNEVRARIRQVDRTEPVYEIKTAEQMMSEQRSGVEASANIMTGNALIALFLAITGIYAVMSYFVSQRTKEIGVRMALGAATWDVLKMTIGQACRVAGIGFLIGVPVAYVLMRILSSVLFNVVVVKWTTFSAVTVVLAFAAILAAFIPARRAAGVDPVIVLRNE